MPNPFQHNARGGYVIADGHGEDEFQLQAVTSLGECAAAVRGIVEERFQPVEPVGTDETLEFPKVFGAVNENSPKRGRGHYLLLLCTLAVVWSLILVSHLAGCISAPLRLDQHQRYLGVQLRDCRQSPH